MASVVDNRFSRSYARVNRQHDAGSPPVLYAPHARAAVGGPTSGGPDRAARPGRHRNAVFPRSDRSPPYARPKNLCMWCPPTRCRRGVLRSHVLHAPPLLLFVPPTRLDASGATGRCSTNQGKCTTNKDCKNKPTDPGSCIYTSDQAHGLVAGKLACIRACAPAMLCQRFRVRPGQLGPPLLLNCDGYTACSNLFGRTGNRRSGFIF